MSDPGAEGDATTARIDRLEMRLSYQEQAIETLNETVTAQWKHIDALTRRLADFDDRLRQAETGSGITTAHERPPHY
jgi:SlyX protein